MRYYELKITPQPKTASPEQQEQTLACSVPLNTTGGGGNLAKPIVFSTLSKSGQNNLNALQIDVDLPVCEYDTVKGNNALIKVYGIDLELIKQATNYNGALIELSAGMSKGLPLAKPEQNGLIMTGSVFKAFGNWQGEQMTLDLVINALTSYASNYTFTLKAGEQLSEVIKRVLSTNHPDYILRVNIADNLTLSADETGAYYTLSQFAQVIRRISRAINTDPLYYGVGISIKGKNIIVQDGTNPKQPQNISFMDLVGQPTWLDFGTVQFKTVMRADLHVGDVVKLPDSLYRLSSKSNQGFKKDKTAFSGVFTIINVRHVGSSRQPDANSWCSIYDCLEVI